MRYLMVLCMLFCVGCVAFSQAGYTDADGNYHQPQVGVVDQIASGLGAASPLVPFAGLASMILGVVGGAGTLITRKRRKDDAEETVKLIDNLKKNVGNLANDKQVVKFVNENIPKDKSYGKLLQAAYEHLKKQGDIK